MTRASEVRTVLRALEAELDAQGAPFSELALPPASTSAMALLEAAAGPQVPDALREWWQWHDGLTDGEPFSGLDRCWHVAPPVDQRRRG